MRTFIQLSADGKKAHWKFKAEEKPEFAPYIVIVDVTGMEPEPEEGWIWDGEKFSPPPPPAPPKPSLEELVKAVLGHIAGDIDKSAVAELWCRVKDA